MKNKIKIISSLDHDTSKNDVINYANDGIDEFYFGFMPQKWIQKYGWEICANRRPYPVHPHITDWGKANELIKTVHKKKKNIYLALNEHSYIKKQYKLLIPLLKKMIDFDIDGILVADLALINYLKINKIKIPIHLSIGAGTFNSETVKFFYKLGAERIILPRKLTISEIKQIMVNSPKKVKFEIFLIGEWCRYNDAYCFNVHGYNKNEFCKIKEINKKRETLLSHTYLNEKLNYPWCGLCIISYLKKYLDKIIFKIPLRSDVFNNRALLKKIVPLIKKNVNNKTFQKELKCKKNFCAYELT